MSCKFTWYNLPNQIKAKIKPFENQLSKEAKNITWFNMPYKLIVLYNELALIKFSCKKQINFIWFTLNEKANEICELIDCLNFISIIIANPDTITTTSSTLGLIGNVLTNDTLNSLPATISNVSIDVIAPANRFLQIDTTTGDISIIGGTLIAGVYTISYNICEIANPTNCSLPVNITIIVV